VELFAKNSADLKTQFIRCVSKADALKALKELAQLDAWQRIAYHREALAAEMAEGLGLPGMTTYAGYDVYALEKSDVGISVCDALIAQTGSVMLSTRSAGGRALTVLPPHHVVIATRDQLFSDLAAGYEHLGKLYGSKWPSFSTIITGPSRTGDIERILVLGAHGPKKLTIILIESTGL
jgi:L-lactate dehydrogenase complex protein LldG